MMDRSQPKLYWSSEYMEELGYNKKDGPKKK